MKGVFISKSARGSGSSSMSPPSKGNQWDKGKGVIVTLSEEEKKKKQALVIERQRQINNILRVLSNVDVMKLPEKNQDDFLIGVAHIKVFIDNYYDFLAITDIELAIAINKTSKVPQSLLKGKI
ncbi:unnamed protein product [Lactuca saligna]|uniref:Uncharacterized protein n=1 Tax=Lactuca saligna TaxID=75948 RepID=A0AA35ZN06_LACSI|nr:unnamed protein product [Lactuca saligna]